MIVGAGVPVALHLMDNAMLVTAVTLEPTSTVNDPLSRSIRELETAEILGGEVSERRANDIRYHKIYIRRSVCGSGQ